MSRKNGHLQQHRRRFRCSDVVDLYRCLSDGEPSGATWMGTDRETALWLFDGGESIPEIRSKNVAVHRETARMGERIGSPFSGIPGWALLTVAAVVTTVDLALTYWIAHWLLRWI